MLKRINLFICVFISLQFVVAQQTDTANSNPKSISVISAFKPKINIGKKLNFDVPFVVYDSLTVPLKYRFPELNIDNFYEPFPTYPLLLNIAALQNPAKLNLLSFGYGNFDKIDAKLLINIISKQTSFLQFRSNYQNFVGNIPFQQSTHFNFDAAYIKSRPNVQHIVNIRYNFFNNYRYGWNKQDSNINPQNYTTSNPINVVELNYQLDNQKNTLKKWLIKPKFSVRYLNDGEFNEKSELFYDWSIPFRFKINHSNSFGFIGGSDWQLFKFQKNSFVKRPYLDSLTANFSSAYQRYYVKGVYEYNSSVVQFNTQLDFNIYNNQFYFLPSFELKLRLFLNNLFISSGINTQFQPNSFYTMYQTNPYVDVFNDQINLINHFQGFIKLYLHLYNNFLLQGKFSFNQYLNFPLYNPSQISPAYQEYIAGVDLKSFRLDLENNWRIQDNFELVTSLFYENFSQLDSFENPYGAIPFQLKSNLIWKISPKFVLRSSVKFISGTYYFIKDENNNLIDKQLTSGLFFNVGGSYLLKKKWEFWAQFDNIFNSNYSRWTNIPALGFQAQVGLTYYFRVQK